MKQRRLFLALFALVLSIPAVCTLPGCSKDSSAESKPKNVYVERNQKIRSRLKKIKERLGRLPQRSPDQRVAHAKVTNLYRVTRINFEAKVKARLDQGAEAVYKSTERDLREIEKMIKKFPE